jgi:pyroglutamyl-peptidase
MIKKVLLTGFDPFGGEQVNPAWEAVKQFEGKTIEEVEFYVHKVPTVFEASIRSVVNSIEHYQPDAVICVGQAGGRSQITPERIAININDASIPDNDKNQPIDQSIYAEGPAAYWSTLPIKRIMNQLKENGIPASVSNTAGTFVCNHLFYGLMHHLNGQMPGVKGGFIHIPFLPEQAIGKNAPSMGLELIIKGIEIAALTTARSDKDLQVAGGALH